MNKAFQLWQLFRNMGGCYFTFRLKYELQRKTGILRKKFPKNPPVRQFISLTEWKKDSSSFFFCDQNDLCIPKQEYPGLVQELKNILEGKILYFNGSWLNIGLDDDWVTNPDSGYQYDVNRHWTEVEDIVEAAGDIKYVWEKSRFSFLYSVIRYDVHYRQDHSAFVFGQILDWIAKNPVNCGPNYKCSQEISLRVLNWIFALHFYRNSKELTEEVFQKIVHTIYWQIQHVYQNINFSRIAVRNNHAITETLTLYLVGLLFSEFPEAAKWEKDGKRWFEEEIAYQIAEDGTYLQFSMNYHRVVVQLLTWAIALADRNGEKFADVVYERAYQSINFLYQCQDEVTGWLPNYGANDGALFFKWNDNHYRDYRPQLNALHYLLTGEHLYKPECRGEDVEWYISDWKASDRKLFMPLRLKQGAVEFPMGGYYLIREPEALTFIRCGKYRDRPSHADNLHVDIWWRGENILMDGGSFKYNTQPELVRYFSGTASHNTVMLDDHDQMLKGPRFIWLNWSQALGAELKECEEEFEFSGEVSCFISLDKHIVHKRVLWKRKGELKWYVTDKILNKPHGIELRQLWHTQSERLRVDGENMVCNTKDGWFSSLYGQKEKVLFHVCRTLNNSLQTIISIDK